MVQILKRILHDIMALTMVTLVASNCLPGWQFKFMVIGTACMLAFNIRLKAGKGSVPVIVFWR